MFLEPFAESRHFVLNDAVEGVAPLCGRDPETQKEIRFRFYGSIEGASGLIYRSLCDTSEQAGAIKRYWAAEVFGKAEELTKLDCLLNVCSCTPECTVVEACVDSTRGRRKR